MIKTLRKRFIRIAMLAVTALPYRQCRKLYFGG